MRASHTPRASRSITTCQNCRRRKLKCDRSRPQCQRCINDRLECVYDPTGQQPLEYRFVSETPYPTSSSAGAQNPPPGYVTVPVERLQDIESRIKALSESLAGAHEESGSSAEVTGAHTPDVTPNPSALAHLTTREDGTIRYVDSSFWAAICRRVSELDELLGHEALTQTSRPATPELFTSGPTTWEREDAGSAGDLFSHVAGTTPLMPTLTGNRNEFWQMIDDLPARDICDSLLRFYFEGYQPIAALFHISWFERKYAEFWDITLQRADDEQDHAETCHFLSLLLATLFAGSVVAAGLHPDDPRSVEKIHDVRDHLHRLGVRSLRLNGFPRAATLDTLSAYALLQDTEMRPEEPFACVAFIGVAVRVATILGLHRDPKHFFPFIEPVEAERRRRVWWHLAHVDVLIAVATGIPPLIDLSTTDVRAVSEVREMYHGTGTEARYDRLRIQGHGYAAESRQLICTMGIFLAGKILASLHLRKMLATIAQGPTVIAAGAEALQRDIGILKQELSLKSEAISMPFEPLMTDILDYEDNEDLRQWSTLILSIYLDHHFSVIGASILRSASETTWPLFRELCLQHCQSLLLKLTKLTHTESFRKFHWSWPGNHSPLHAVMLLLSDIDEGPSTATAARSRRVLDLVFAFVTGNDGIVPEPTGLRPLSAAGKETWAYLRRARKAAWERAGWGEPREWVGGREEAVMECKDLWDSV